MLASFFARQRYEEYIRFDWSIVKCLTSKMQYWKMCYWYVPALFLYRLFAYWRSVLTAVPCLP